MDGLNLEAAAARILELERACLAALAEARAFCEFAARERDAARREREELARDFTEAEAATLLNISTKTLREERRNHKFPHIKHGVKVTYTAEHIRIIREMRTQNKSKVRELK
jgi:hypothetical protein